MPFSSVLGASSVIKPGVCTSTTRPTVPYEGQLIYETDTDRVAAYNGSAWVYTATGAIVQVVNSAYSTEVTTTSQTSVTTGLSATITPTSSLNKILVIWTLMFLQQDTTLVHAQLRRGSTDIVGDRTPAANNRLGNTAEVSSWSGTFLDSPATTSSTTYAIWGGKNTAGGSAVGFQWNSQQTSTMTLMEVRP